MVLMGLLVAQDLLEQLEILVAQEDQDLQVPKATKEPKDQLVKVGLLV